jgi:hypothetical protein
MVCDNIKCIIYYFEVIISRVCTCGIKVGKEPRIFVLFAIRNSSVRSATIGSANSLFIRKKIGVILKAFESNT